MNRKSLHIKRDKYTQRKSGENCKMLQRKVKLLFIILSPSQLRPGPWAYETV